MNSTKHIAKTNHPKNNPGKKSLFFQPKLSINPPNDIYEQEADAMSEKIMRMPANENIFFKPTGVFVQRKCAHCEEEEKQIQRKENSSLAVEASGETSSYIHSLSSKGTSLSNDSKNFFESRFGYDFSGVKIHSDSDAARSAQSINALAYTVGNEIVFNNGQYSPHTDTGKKLLAHELTHVIQQNHSVSAKKIQRKIGDGHDLKSPRFAGDPILEACFDGEHLMRSPESGDAVKKVQQALIDAGYALPKFGVDGKFGDETGKAVSKFKSDGSISPSDGVVGPKTMAALDALFTPTPPPTTVESKQVPSNIDIKTKEQGEVKNDGKTKDPKLDVKTQNKQTVNHDTKKEEEKEAPFQFTAAIGVQNIWITQFAGPPQDTGFCSQGLLQIGGKWNWRGIPLGKKLTLFSEPELDVSLVPLLCGKAPGISLQDNILKLEIMKKIWELSLVGVFGLQDDWLKNWGNKPLTGMVGPQLDWHPWGDRDTKWYSNIKFTVNISTVWNRQPAGTQDSWGVAGTGSVGIEIP